MYGFVTVPEFSVLYGISTDTVYRLVKKDAIPYYRVGKNIRIRIDDFRKGVKQTMKNSKFWKKIKSSSKRKRLKSTTAIPWECTSEVQSEHC